MGCIYKLTSPSGGVYIGKTNRSLEQRIKEHAYAADAGKSHKICGAIRKYGLENFKVDVLFDEVDSNDELNYLEIEEIKKHKDAGINLYNMTDGGEGIVGYLSEETYSKIFTDEYKENMSQIFKEKWKDPEYVKAVLDGRNNRTPEDIERLTALKREIAAERWKDESYRSAMIKMARDLWKDESHRKKMSEACKHIYTMESWLEANRHRTTELWQDAEYREKNIANRRRTYATKEYKENKSRSQSRANYNRSPLDTELVTQIKDRLEQGVPQSKIAKEFGVGQSTISRIKLNKVWTSNG